MSDVVFGPVKPRYRHLGHGMWLILMDVEYICRSFRGETLRMEWVVYASGPSMRSINEQLRIQTVNKLYKLKRRIENGLQDAP